MRRALPTLALLTLTACEGSIVGTRAETGGSKSPAGEAPLPAFAPAPLRPRLLLSAQYVASIADLLGPAAAQAVTPPRDVPVNGLTAVGATELSISSVAVEAYETNAYLAAQAALMANRAALIPCAPSTSSDAACMRQVAERFVPRAFRRPATEVELQRWTGLGVSAAQAYDVFDRGVEFLLAGLLQSPAFLYLDETGEPDPADPTLRRLTPHELASRLSYFLTNAPPDLELRALADSGAIADEATLRAQATRLLARPEARQAMTALFDELLGLGDLDHLSKDAQRFPGFDATLGLSMREETRRTLVDTAFDAPTDFRDVFTRRTTFVDGRLAQHYGLSPVTQWTAVAAPAGRAGILTQASFLALMSHPSANSPTYRGKFIRERLLCESVPAPPANVNTTLPPATTGVHQTLRQKVQQHMQSPSCSGCHAMMDPLGFAFEGFDAIGRAQTLDDTLPVDTTGSLDTAGTFADAPGLMNLLHDDPRVVRCLTRVAYRQGVGHVDLDTEARPLRAATDAFAASGYRYQTLLVELAASEAFRTGRLETP